MPINNDDLIKALRGRGLNALSDGLPTEAPPPTSLLNQLRDYGANRGMELKWALGYPGRVWNRAFPPYGENSDRMRAMEMMNSGVPYAPYGFQPLEQVLGRYPYPEDGRESDSFEDRRPTSLWQYK